MASGEAKSPAPKYRPPHLRRQRPHNASRLRAGNQARSQRLLTLIPSAGAEELISKLVLFFDEAKGYPYPSSRCEEVTDVLLALSESVISTFPCETGLKPLDSMKRIIKLYFNFFVSCLVEKQLDIPEMYIALNPLIREQMPLTVSFIGRACVSVRPGNFKGS